MWKPALLLSAIVARVQQLPLTEADLQPYDSTGRTQPIYLAINGAIYDVSASPSY
jgi:hypothetical protein